MQSLAAATALGLLLCACNASHPDATRDARAEENAESPLLENNKRVVLRFLQEVFIDGNAAVVDELCATDVVNHAAAPNSQQGIDGIKRVAGFSRAAQPDQRWTWKNVVAEGDLVIVYGVREATWQAEKFRGFATPQGKHVAVELAHMFRLRDGKIAEHWAVRDDLGMMQQLGVVPSAVPSAAPPQRAP
jgi:predicted ester cyclase